MSWRSRTGAVALAALMLPAGAAGADQAGEYHTCLKLVGRDAAQAFEAALAWRERGGGAPARHCAALALVQLGLYAEAAARLEELAAALPAEGRVRAAEVLAQAANAWLLAEQIERAEGAARAAAAWAPEDAELLVDLARIVAEAGRDSEALALLERALTLAPEHDDAQAFRAAALRRLGRPGEGLAAAEQALRLNQENAVALLERGLAHRQLGDRRAARADLHGVVRRHAGTPAANAAQRELETLDLKVE
ncbi:MAG: hypothetical protein FJX68_00960 [Alphaproteobacteria bacterium]|nr:hypothetical protein [Alphaproteobacteria bacterium]